MHTPLLPPARIKLLCSVHACLTLPQSRNTNRSSTFTAPAWSPWRLARSPSLGPDTAPEFPTASMSPLSKGFNLWKHWEAELLRAAGPQKLPMRSASRVSLGVCSQARWLLVGW